MIVSCGCHVSTVLPLTSGWHITNGDSFETEQLKCPISKPSYSLEASAESIKELLQGINSILLIPPFWPPRTALGIQMSKSDPFIPFLIHLSTSTSSTVLYIDDLPETVVAAWFHFSPMDFKPCFRWRACCAASSFLCPSRASTAMPSVQGCRDCLTSQHLLDPSKLQRFPVHNIDNASKLHLLDTQAAWPT